MKKLFLNNIGLLGVLFISWIVGCVYLISYPTLFDQPKFLLALPFILAFFLLLIVNCELALMIILLIRPLLDRLLNETRLGDGIGIGAGFNLAILVIFVIFLIRDQGLPKDSPLNRWWVFFYWSFFRVFFILRFLFARCAYIQII